ncbi:hypothetical protein [Vibrio atypicus]|uniref:hypothetical protein n=1 Tax=Vibrio atypicus TaxID=558271 RepID=UPI0037368B01
MKWLVYLFEQISSDSGYKTLFKGGVALATLFLVATMQVSNTMLPIEKSAYELRYKVEAELGKSIDSFAELSCDIKNKKTYADCKLAKYQKKLSSSSVVALTEFQSLVQWLACLLFAVSIFGFFLNPYVHGSSVKTESTSESEAEQ